MSAHANLDIQLRYRWEAVETAPNVPLRFPDALTPHLRRCWSGPAVYRWVVSRREHGDLRRVYIGETDNLPRRIYGYLYPARTQHTNLRLRALFDAEVASGNMVRLDVLRFAPFALGATKVLEDDLADKLTRRFLEHLLAVYHARDGYTLINA